MAQLDALGHDLTLDLFVPEVTGQQDFGKHQCKWEDDVLGHGKGGHDQDGPDTSELRGQ